MRLLRHRDSTLPEGNRAIDFHNGRAQFPDFMPEPRLGFEGRKRSRPMPSNPARVTALGTVFLVLPLATASILQAQPEPATVYNIASNAPVTVTGNVTCSERMQDSDDSAGELQFRNASSLGIVALQVVAILKCTGYSPFPINYSFDRLFFEARGLPSGESIAHFVPRTDRQESGALNASSSPSRVDIEIRLVQFEDGSTWGDASILGRVRARRQKIELVLNRLASAPDDQAFDSMLTEMLSTNQQDPVAYTTAYKIDLLRKKSGTESAMTSVRERLEVAAERDASGKF